MKKLLLILLIALTPTMPAWSNGIVLSNLTSVSGSGYVQLQFDLSWNNSWYNSTNHDAAWVFFKFKDNDGTWHHLNLTNANNAITSGYTITVPTDKTGAMIYRSSTGSGTVTLTGVRVGVNNLPGSFDVKGFAIEMVQIPMADPYYLGDGESGSYFENGATGAPFYVSSNSITMGTATGQLNDGISGGNIALSSSFPIGYNSLGAFYNWYIMKHEVSQAAYRDFLNTLTYTQQAARTTSAPSSVAGTAALGGIARNSIEIATAGTASSVPAVYGCDLNANNTYNESSDGEWIACNEMTWMDLAAFLDWAALRPMTELEFEKACRGTTYPVSAENAAGTSLAAAYSYTLTSSGTTSEAVSYSASASVLAANITYNSTAPGGNAPIRVGAHATANSTRISAGAGFYGCLDLSGNVEEFVVRAGSNAGSSFTGVHGDGELTTSGDANEDYWPGINGNTTTTVANTAFGGTTGVTGAAGIMVRGGGAGTTGLNTLKVSYRISSAGTSSRTSSSGGRGTKSW